MPRGSIHNFCNSTDTDALLPLYTSVLAGGLILTRMLCNMYSCMVCRPFVRSCLFQPLERQRLHKVVQQAATNSHVSGMLESNAPVEIAAQAAITQQWDR